jgi:hypothetical protein
VSRLADVDNESDEYHVPVPVVDVWAEYHRLRSDEKWELKRIAAAKGCDEPLVSRRCKWHSSLCKAARAAVCDGLFDEGHLIAFDGVTCDVTSLRLWLTTERAQAELVEEVLGRHRGKTSDDEKIKKPTVAVVRKAAARWKELIAAAEKAYAELAGREKDGDRWQKMFVRQLVLSDGKKPARTVGAVTAAHRSAIEVRKRAAGADARRLGGTPRLTSPACCRCDRGRGARRALLGIIVATALSGG